MNGWREWQLVNSAFALCVENDVAFVQVASMNAFLSVATWYYDRVVRRDFQRCATETESYWVFPSCLVSSGSIRDKRVDIFVVLFTWSGSYKLVTGSSEFFEGRIFVALPLAPSRPCRVAYCFGYEL